MSSFRICRFMTIHEALRMPRAARYGLVQDLPKSEPKEPKDRQEVQRAEEYRNKVRIQA